MRVVSFPPLLMWHWYFLAWLAGVWGARFFLPSLTAFTTILLFYVFFLFSSHNRDLFYSVCSISLSKTSVVSIRFLFLFIFFSVGLAAGNVSLPERPFDLQEPKTLPAFVRNKQKVQVQGVVQDVITSPNRRVKFILSDVKYTLPEGVTQELPGKVVWTWANWRDGVRKQKESGGASVPLLRPMTGETVSLKARLMPVVGFRNKGTWSSGEYWRDRGVFWRMWTWGSSGIPHRTGSPSMLALWREELRFHVSQLLSSEDAAISFLALQVGKLSKTAWKDAMNIVPALLFGDKYGFSSGRHEQLSRASLSHSFALSGMHLGIVALGITFLLSLCVRRAEWYEIVSRSKLFALGILPATAVYVWIGGASPSLVRAFIMCACWCLLIIINRPKVFMDGLFIALVLLTVWNPLIVFDLRLQLSALAIVAMGVALPFSRAIKEKMFKQPASSIWQKLKRGAFDTFFFSTAIQLVLLPVVIWNFNEVSMWTVLNMLWLPLLGALIMPLLFLGLVVAWCSMLFAPLMGIAQELFIVSATPVALLFAFLDDLEQAGLLSPIIVARPHWLTIVGWYGALASCVVWWSLEGKMIVPQLWSSVVNVFSVREKKFYHWVGLPLVGDSLQGKDEEYKNINKLGWCSGAFGFDPHANVNGRQGKVPPSRKRTAVCFVARLYVGMFLCVLVFPAVSSAYSVSLGSERKTTMQVLDVGQGQAILLNFPNGKRLLLDGGGFSSRSFDVGKALIMPCITRQHNPRLQWIMSTHPDTDHIRGLFYPLAYGDVGKYLATDAEVRGWNKKQLRLALKRSGVGTGVLAKGDVLTVSENLELEVLHPAKGSSLEGNNKSLVLRLVKHDGAERVGLVLLTGDIELEGINALLASGVDLSAEVLILPHHGSRTSYSEQFYEAVSPKMAIASCGYLNKYNFPDEHVRSALERKGISVLTTAIRGEIDITLDSN